MRATWMFGVAMGIGAVCWSGLPDAASAVKVPISCNKGPSGQSYQASLQLPAQVTEGGTFALRVDGVDSGKISQVGLNYVTQMTYEYAVPQGTTVVDGSARIVPDTGTANVRSSARVSANGGVIQMVLPAHVDNGESYTPPSFEVKLTATAPAGATITVPFRQYRVTANAFLVGDVKAVCDPSPKPFTVGSTRVVAAAE